MVKLTVKWATNAELYSMKIYVGKKMIFDDLISKISLEETKNFLNESLTIKETFFDKNTNENIITGDISEDDLQELCEYFDIQPVK